MKVVFIENVPNVARAGEIKEVADGYGRNFLIPRKLAMLADSGALGAVKAHLELKARNQAQTEAELRELASNLEGQEITLEARAGTKDRLYGSVTASDIASELENATGYTIDRKKIDLEEPIHQLGSYEVAIRLAKDIVPKIRVTVSEKAD